MKRAVIMATMVFMVLMSGGASVSQKPVQQLTCTVITTKGRSRCWCWKDGKPYKAPMSFCKWTESVPR